MTITALGVFLVCVFGLSEPNGDDRQLIVIKEFNGPFAWTECTVERDKMLEMKSTDHATCVHDIKVESGR